MSNEQLEQFVSKLVMRLSDIDNLKTSIDNLKTSVDTTKDLVSDLKFDYGIRHTKNESKLEAIHDIVTKQNSRIFKLEESTIKSREEHLTCKAPNKINQLEKKLEDMIFFKDKMTARKISIFAIVFAGVTLVINFIDKIITYIK